MKLTLYFPDTFADTFLAGHARELDTDAHPPGYEWTIGRHPNSDIRIRHQEVSVHHAAISYSPKAQSWSIQDLGSSNGTWMNRAKLKPKDLFPLEMDSSFFLSNPSLRIFALEKVDDTLGREDDTLIDDSPSASSSRTYADSLYLAIEWLISGKTLTGKIWRVAAAAVVVGTAIIAWEFAR